MKKESIIKNDFQILSKKSATDLEDIVIVSNKLADAFERFEDALEHIGNSKKEPNIEQVSAFIYLTQNVIFALISEIGHNENGEEDVYGDYLTALENCVIKTRIYGARSAICSYISESNKSIN